jgi:membrane fusion protein, macrolide-specific efflux system
MNKRRQINWIAVAVVVIALGVGGYFAWRAWGPSSAENASATTAAGRTVTVERGDVVSTLTVYGTVVPKQQYTYTFNPDQVSEILVKEGNRVSKGQILVKLTHDQQELALLQAQDALNTAKAEGTPATIKEKQLAYDIAQANYNAATLTAPFAGVVAQVNQATGSSDQDSIVLVDTTELYIDADVDQLDIPGVSVGQEATATIDALPDKTWPVKIVSVGGMATRSGNTSTVTVTASLPNPDPAILVGFSAQLEITTAKASGVLRVPVSSLLQVGNRWLAMKVVNGKTEPQPVELGVTSDQWAEVKSGLSEGDEILLYPESSTSSTTQRSSSSSQAGGFFRTNGGSAPGGFPGMP